MLVPFFRPAVGPDEIAAVVRCLESGWLTTGALTREFEDAFRAVVGTKHAIALNSCTAALHLALEALGVGRGDSILVPTLTFTATAEVANYLGATPIFIDVDQETLCMCPQSLAQRLEEVENGQLAKALGYTPGPIRACLPVHYGGQAAPMAEIADVLAARGIPIVEDCAHALPSAYRTQASDDWKSVGSMGSVGCFSFYANKCITTGEGGMAVTDDDDVAARMRLMSLHGMSKDAWNRFGTGAWDYQIVEAGYKYNLTDVASAMGNVQLGRMDELREARLQIAQAYQRGLADLPVHLPREVEHRRHSWHLFPLRVAASERSAVFDQLHAAGITCSVHWRPLHMQPFYRRFCYTNAQLPVASAEWERLISLPIFPGMHLDEVSHVIQTLRRILDAG